MKINIAIFVALLHQASLANLKIVTTAPEFADLARQIGGDKVTVRSVMKGPENVHNVMARPTEMLALNQANLFVHGGLDGEPWRDNLIKGARNPRILAGKPGNVDMSTGIDLKDVPEQKASRDQGDIHAFGNPHYQLDPAATQRMTVTLAKAMMAIDPVNAELYRENAKRIVQELGELAKSLREQLAAHKGAKVVTFHPAWKYFAEAFGIEIVATIEPKPAITPSPAQVRDLIQQMKQQGVKVVICETYSDNKLARYVADQAGAKLLILPDHVHGVKEADSYQNLFRHNVEQILNVLKQGNS